MKRVLWLAFVGIVVASSPLSAEEPRLKTAQEYCARGSDYLNKSDFDRAIADFTEAIRLDPTFAEAYFGLGATYGRRVNMTKRLPTCTQAIRLDPKLAGAFYNMGVVLPIRRANTTRRSPTLRTHPSRSEEMPMPIVERGMHLREEGRIGQGDRRLYRGRSSEPEVCRGVFDRSIAYVRKGDHDKAIADSTESIQLNPTFAMAYHNRGVAYAKKGEYDKAIADFTEAIGLDPKYANAYCDRGSTYGNKGDYDKAVVDFNEAIRLNPQDAELYYNRSVAYEKKGDKAKAEADLNKANNLSDNRYKASDGSGTVR